METFLRAFSRSLVAAAGTGLGGLLLLFATSAGPSARFVALANGASAGIMLGLCCFDLIPEAIAHLGLGIAATAFFAGGAFLQLVSHVLHRESFKQRLEAASAVLPDLHVRDPGQQLRETARRTQLMLSAALTAIVLAVHNAPEGLAVLFASQDAANEAGLALVAAITMHNVGEGFAVAASTYGATQSVGKSIALAALSGLAEPLSVIVGHVLLSPYITPQTVQMGLAAVAGTMASLCVFELVPLSMSGAGNGDWKAAVAGGVFASVPPLVLLAHVR